MHSTAEAQKESAYTSACRVLEGSLNELSDSIGALYSRLAPVRLLGQDKPPSGSGLLAPQPPASPIVLFMKEQTAKIRELNNTITEILSDIEV